MDATYSGSLILLNLLFLLKYRYFKGEEELESLVEEVITVMIYFMLMTLVLKLLWECFPLSFVSELLDPKAEDKASEEDGDDQKKEGENR